MRRRRQINRSVQNCCWAPISHPDNFSPSEEMTHSISENYAQKKAENGEKTSAFFPRRQSLSLSQSLMPGLDSALVSVHKHPSLRGQQTASRRFRHARIKMMPKLGCKVGCGKRKKWFWGLLPPKTPLPPPPSLPSV